MVQDGGAALRAMSVGGCAAGEGGAEVTPTLWHFTCAHARERIGKRGTLTPNRHPLLPELPGMVWLTSDPCPERESVGLTSTRLKCDRLEYRYRVLDSDVAVPWCVVRRKVRPELALMLDYGRTPETWFVSFKPVKVRLAQLKAEEHGTPVREREDARG